MKKKNPPMSVAALLLIGMISLLVIVTAIAKDVQDNRTKAAQDAASMTE